MYFNIDLETPHTSREFELGALGSRAGGAELYQYILFNDGASGSGTDAAAGHLIVGMDGGFPAYEGTNDNNHASANRNKPLGFAQYAMNHGEYGWVQCWGRSRQDATTDGSVSQFQQLMAHATTTGGIDSHDATATAVVGTAEEADGVTAATTLDAGDMFIQIRSG